MERVEQPDPGRFQALLQFVRVQAPDRSFSQITQLGLAIILVQ